MADEDPKPPDVDWRRALSTIGLALAIPWMMGVPIYLGWWLDQRFQTWPLWFLVGLFVGLFSTAFDVYRLMKRLGQFK